MAARAHYRKRGCHIVRDRCIEFREILRKNGVKEIPLQAAKILFMNSMGICDRTSLQAYFGSQAHRSTRKLERMARYSSGIVSLKTIELSQQVPTRKGYLELLGIVASELRGKTWFLVIQHEPLVPEMSTQHCERHDVGLSESIANFSLSPLEPFSQGERGMGETDLRRCPPEVDGIENTQTTTTYRVRERNQSSESEAHSVCLDAYPSESAKDGRTDDPG
jgi:hypothetical protein